MQIIEPGPLFDIRFRLRTFFAAVTAFCCLLAASPLIDTEAGYATFSTLFLLASAVVAAHAIWFASQNAPRYLGNLIIYLLCIAAFIMVGPILAYHINGRAWYDYGLSKWDPPPYQLSNGTVCVHDYDPKYTRPAIWPVLGPIMYEMCWMSGQLILFPPTAPVVSIACLTSTIRLRNVLSRRQIATALLAWSIGSLPLLYMLFWSVHVLEWIAD